MVGEENFNLIFEVNNRLRVLESKHNLLREKTLIINENMLEQYKKISQEIKLINEDIKDLKKDLQTIKETTKHVVSEMEAFARKDSLKILEKYINMWNPLHFVTEQEVIKLIKEQTKKKVK